jgi:prolyl-tRNA synthetase
MGSYGIGLDRILAATIEAHHDDDGIRFPMSIAPFEVLVVAIDVKDEEVLSAAKEVHDQLAERGIEVLLDNRDERAGFKFKDADLIGVPLRITVSRKILVEKIVELKSRTASNVERLAPEAAIEEVVRRVEAARSAVEEV